MKLFRIAKLSIAAEGHRRAGARRLVGAVMAAALLACGGLSDCRGADSPAAPAWLAKPLSLEECLNIALEHNGNVLKSKKDLEATHGVVVQTRAIAIPKVRATGDYEITDEGAVDRLTIDIPPGFPGLGNFTGINPGNQRWSANVRLIQSIYEGGRMRAALRTARFTTEQALAQHNVVLANTATDVRIAFYDVLLAEQEIVVNEASVELLSKELEDTKRRFAAGTVPRFNVLRAEVELANARPKLIRARNSYRIGKDNLVNLLGYHLPTDIWEDVPIHLSGSLQMDKLEIELPKALMQALERRPELVALRAAQKLRKEGVTTARAGYLPSVQGYVGYGSHNSAFTPDLANDISGWQAGVQLSWDLFDGMLTVGKVGQARALLERSEVETDDSGRQIEMEVRTAYSNLIESWEVLQSQGKVQEQAEEALRLARARGDAGTGTQLDVLSAQTALTEARTTQIGAQRDYAVARSRLERAIGAYVPVGPSGQANATAK